MGTSDAAAQNAKLVEARAASDTQAVGAANPASQCGVTRLSGNASKLIGVGIQIEVFEIGVSVRLANRPHGVRGDGLGLDLVDAGSCVEFVGGRVALVKEVERDA